jgi:hypothetical protein
MSIVGTSLARYFLPLLLISILVGIFATFAVMVGIFLLIIGAFFAIIYVVMISTFVSPVMMIENKDIGHTITRTVQLSHKTFWPNIGWVCVFGILLMVISGILGMVVMIPYGGSFFKVMMNPESAMEIMDFTQKPLFIILSALTNAVTMPLYPIFAVVLYFSRVNKESGASVVSEDNNISVKDLTP